MSNPLFFPALRSTKPLLAALTGLEARVYLAALVHADFQTGEFYPSVETLARLISTTRPRVREAFHGRKETKSRRATKGLVGHGLIVVLRHGGGIKNPNVYRLAVAQTGITSVPVVDDAIGYHRGTEMGSAVSVNGYHSGTEMGSAVSVNGYHSGKKRGSKRVPRTTQGTSQELPSNSAGALADPVAKSLAELGVSSGAAADILRDHGRDKAGELVQAMQQRAKAGALTNPDGLAMMMLREGFSPPQIVLPKLDPAKVRIANERIREKEDAILQKEQVKYLAKMKAEGKQPWTSRNGSSRK